MCSDAVSTIKVTVYGLLECQSISMGSDNGNTNPMLGK